MRELTRSWRVESVVTEITMRAKLDFECEFCGSPAVSLPPSLYASATVSCAACQAPVGTWDEYKTLVSAAIQRSGAIACADPILALAPSAPHERS